MYRSIVVARRSLFHLQVTHTLLVWYATEFEVPGYPLRIRGELVVVEDDGLVRRHLGRLLHARLTSMKWVGLLLLSSWLLTFE